jgi:NADP-dependent 3-hydroxy acid dehydrogenase YdfG
MTTQTNSPKVILITGASSGIGEAAARLLATRSQNLVIGARRIGRLAALAEEIQTSDGWVCYRALDVTSAAEVDAFPQFALGAFGRIDAIVNNAGVMPLSPLASLKIDEWNQMIDVNVRDVPYGIAAIRPTMERHAFGHVIKISSIGGLSISPTVVVYCATKFAVRAISDCQHREIEAIRVTVIYPGVVASELADSISDDTNRARCITSTALRLPQIPSRTQSRMPSSSRPTSM